MYNDADAVLNDSKETWALKASIAYSKKNVEKTKTLVEEGILKYADAVSDEDYKRAVRDYLKIFKDFL